MMLQVSEPPQLRSLAHSPDTGVAIPKNFRFLRSEIVTLIFGKLFISTVNYPTK